MTSTVASEVSDKLTGTAIVCPATFLRAHAEMLGAEGNLTMQTDFLAVADKIEQLQKELETAQEVCRGAVSGLKADREEIEQLRKALREWYTARETLSSDCKRLGISSSDAAKWGQELSRRCEPLRKFCAAHEAITVEATPV